MLPSKIDQMKVSHETGIEANFGFGPALMPSLLEMRPPKVAFFSFWMQPNDEVATTNNHPRHLSNTLPIFAINNGDNRKYRYR